MKILFSISKIIFFDICDLDIHFLWPFELSYYHAYYDGQHHVVKFIFISFSWMGIPYFD